MKRILIPLLLLFAFAQVHSTPVYATSGHSVHEIHCMPAQTLGYMPSHGMRSVCTMPAGARYSVTVFEPFNNAAPSEYVNGKAPSNSNGPRRGKILGPDTDPGQQFPIGEPWILMAFALLFGGVMAWRKKMNVKREK